MMFKILIYGLTLFGIALTNTPNTGGNVEVRLLDNQNAPLVATLDMSKADERVKQFVSDAIEAKMQHIEETMRSKEFVIETLDAKMKTLERIMKSQITNFERNLTNQLTDYINEMVVKVDEENGMSSTYIRWGRSDCSGVNTEIVFSGYAAGEKYFWGSNYRGGASNMLCLPNNPELSDKGGSGSSFIFGTEFQGNEFAPDSNNEDVPCVLCRSSNTASSVMIPGRKSCYAGWKEEYNGILAASAKSHTPSPYICVDINPTYVKGGKRNNDEHLLYVTAMKCGSLPCPPYKDNVQVNCVVCSK
ncbi:unnamed protein product [Mytilus edulis]|uniref:Uncharacterized protein n=1 Tax=Mytilus edulis TaxID=6550 RepID=A0A8S3UEX3_MYTED|nr:unnamed protein product [Mytilus edulis]